MSCVFNVAHNPLRKAYCLIRVIRNTQHKECICPAHYPKADLPGCTGCFSDFLQRVVVCIYNIVKEMNCFFNGFSQKSEIEFPALFCLFEHLYKVY